MRDRGVIILPSREVLLGQRFGSDGGGSLRHRYVSACSTRRPTGQAIHLSHVASLLTPSSRATSDVVIRRLPSIRDVSVLAVVLQP